MVRFKKRYLLVEISCKDGQVDERIDGRVVFDTVKKAVISAHGDYGMACVARSLQVKYLNSVTGVAFIACARDYYRMVWSAVTFIRTITIKNDGHPCVFRVLHVGGTILSCQKFLIRHNKDQLLQLLQNCKTPVERKKVLKIIKKAEKEEISLSVFKVKRKTTENRRKNSDIACDDEEFDSDL
ncbi:hypothetical protein pdam_00012923 [Pocillopora damicornis]|uniref:Ribonuclease P/MRP protein subunit POP5 n=1 Tax=Pocillopora damicornis TaxID=46731 RepID=A0A3M6U173_POCDA|nr:ribonuclease P/MRP protein subunit POP5-like [Pocillopora damicornis]RMX47238.1 hypothetical protein pdam_00012923 [Pocillopora damicornis]